MPWIGSTKNAATSPPASAASSAARSFQGTRTASASSGPKPSRKMASPLIVNAPMVSPWKAWSQKTSFERRVAARASLIAASTASVPELQKKTRS